MNDRYSAGDIRPFRGWLALVLLLLIVITACQAKEPPLSPAAAAFKKEVQDCLDRLCLGVVGAIQKQDVAALNEALKRIEPEALKLCRMCPFRIGIMDKTGETITVYPYKVEALGNFSKYDVVVQTLKNRRINQQRFFLQDGAQIYLICVPLFDKTDLVGIMALSLSAADAQNRYGLTETEFLAINFNIRP